jgi:hypothetical protein
MFAALPPSMSAHPTVHRRRVRVGRRARTRSACRSRSRVDGSRAGRQQSEPRAVQGAGRTPAAGRSMRCDRTAPGGRIYPRGHADPGRLSRTAREGQSPIRPSASAAARPAVRSAAAPPTGEGGRLTEDFDAGLEHPRDSGTRPPRVATPHRRHGRTAGSWSVVRGPWSVVRGPWSVVRGPSAAANPGALSAGIRARISPVPSGRMTAQEPAVSSGRHR